MGRLARRQARHGLAHHEIRHLLALIRLHVENQPQEKLASHAWYTFWYVLPTLPMFLAFPFLLPRLGFWPSLLAYVAITVACFGVTAAAFWRFGIRLI